MDNLSGVVTPGRTNTPSITTATTTTVVASPAASTQRNVKSLYVTNNHASASSVVSVEHTDGTTAIELIAVTLLPGENLIYDAQGQWLHLDMNGAAYLPVMPVMFNQATADQVVSAASLTLIAGSSIAIPNNTLRVGSKFVWHGAISKSAAGTAARSWFIRIGTLNTTGDAIVATFTGGVPTAVVDQGRVDIDFTIRGPMGGSCLGAANYTLSHGLQITGLAVIPTHCLNVAPTTAFNSSTSTLFCHLSLTTGTAEVITVHQMIAELYP